MTTPDVPHRDDDRRDPGSAQPGDGADAEIGRSDDAGGTFEPEEDPEPPG